MSPAEVEQYLESIILAISFCIGVGVILSICSLFVGPMVSICDFFDNLARSTGRGGGGSTGSGTTGGVATTTKPGGNNTGGTPTGPGNGNSGVTGTGTGGGTTLGFQGSGVSTGTHKGLGNIPGYTFKGSSQTTGNSAAGNGSLANGQGLNTASSVGNPHVVWSMTPYDIDIFGTTVYHGTDTEHAAWDIYRNRRFVPKDRNNEGINAIWFSERYSYAASKAKSGGLVVELKANLRHLGTHKGFHTLNVAPGLKHRYYYPYHDVVKPVRIWDTSGNRIQ